MNFELIDKIQDVITIFAIPVFTFVVFYILIIVTKIKKMLHKWELKKNEKDFNDK